MAKSTAGSAMVVPAAELEMAERAILDGEEIVSAPQDAEAISRAILERILKASSLEEVLTPQNLEGWKENLERPAEVVGFRFNRSGFEGGSSVYAVVDLIWGDTGEEASVACGGRNVLMQLVQAARLGAIPFKGQLTGKRTTEGYSALWIIPA